MATVIRLTRKGQKHNAIYRVVVADSRAPRDGKFLEQVGFYNPNTTQPEVRFETPRILDWLGKGAQPSDTVRTLLKNAGVWTIWEAARKGADVSEMVPEAKQVKAARAKLGPKAKARLEAEKAPAPAEAAAE